MDEKLVRHQLAELRDEQKKLEEKREATVSAIRGLEAWLRVYGTSAGVLQTAQLTATSKAAILSRSAPKGRISFRSAVLQVLKDAQGEPLHAREIWRRVQELGAVTTGKHPVSLVDLNALGLIKGHGVERLPHRCWRWAGGDQEKQKGGEA